MGRVTIGGQAVIEGIMMKKDDRYAIAVRTPSGYVDVTIEEYESFVPSKLLHKIPPLNHYIRIVP